MVTWTQSADSAYKRPTRALPLHSITAYSTLHLVRYRDGRLCLSLRYKTWPLTSTEMAADIDCHTTSSEDEQRTTVATYSNFLTRLTNADLNSEVVSFLQQQDTVTEAIRDADISSVSHSAVSVDDANVQASKDKQIDKTGDKETRQTLDREVSRLQHTEQDLLDELSQRHCATAMSDPCQTLTERQTRFEPRGYDLVEEVVMIGHFPVSSVAIRRKVGPDQTTGIIDRQ